MNDVNVSSIQPWTVNGEVGAEWGKSIKYDSAAGNLSQDLTIKVADVQLSGDALQISQALDQYSGYRSQEDYGNQLNILNGDKELLDSNNPYEAIYQEVAQVNGDLSDDEIQNLTQQIIDSKLAPGADIDYLSGGDQTQGSVSLQYGASPFSAANMYGEESGVYSSSGANPYVVKNQFSAQANVELLSGNQVTLKIEYIEELEPQALSTSLGALESMEDYRARIQASIGKSYSPVSNSDYRAVSISFTSSSPLSAEDADHLNQLTSSILVSADSAGRGKMALEGYDLNNAFSDVSQLFKSLEVSGSYSGFAQGDAEYQIELLDSGQLDSQLNVEEKYQAGEIRSIDVERFWQ